MRRINEKTYSVLVQQTRKVAVIVRAKNKDDAAEKARRICYSLPKDYWYEENILTCGGREVEE